MFPLGSLPLFYITLCFLYKRSLPTMLVEDMLLLQPEQEMQELILLRMVAQTHFLLRVLSILVLLWMLLKELLRVDSL